MKEYKLKIWETAALCALCVTLGVCAWAQGRQQDISSSLVRLHVIAASEEAAGQELKMRVRDGVLEYLTPVLDSAESPAQARSIINAEIPNIRAAAEKCAEGVRVEVEDHGPGIAADDLPYIFDRYYRSRSDAGRQGTGLGLSITKAIFQQHGFRFGVQSTVGKGTTFWFLMTSR